MDIINKDPLRGCPPSSVFYGMETDSSLSTHPAFTARHVVGRDLPRPLNRGEQDPANLALEAVGAIRVPVEGIKMCPWGDGAQRLEITRPFKSRPKLFHAYELPPRRVADGAASHPWSYGARLDPRATGQWSDMAEGSKQPPLPPALRNTKWRESLQILQTSQQVGLPCSVHTDASLGWSMYCYQAYEIQLDHCMGARSTLLRVVGACRRGSESPKVGGLPQRAKCGFCPCCTRATHALQPATYEAGSFDRREANAGRLWRLHGPMAPRTYAAAVYFNQFKYLPSSWNWIATKHEAMPPPALDWAARRNTDVSEHPDSQLALEDNRSSRPAPISPSPASSGFYPPTAAPRSGTPPPPICPEIPLAPPKSTCPAYPSYSYKKSSWSGDWKLTSEGDWK